jgi:PilZ domain-containing protein
LACAVSAGGREALLSESRTGKRFPMQLPATIRRGHGKLQGKTSDLSAAGVFIHADGEFEIGSQVEFDITLPAEVIGAKKDVEIHCQGRVVRAHAAGKKEKSASKGLACVIDNYEFVRK